MIILEWIRKLLSALRVSLSPIVQVQPVEDKPVEVKPLEGPVVIRIKSVDEAVKRYGLIKDGKWANEVKWCSLLPIPEEVAKCWINTATDPDGPGPLLGGPTTRIYCNKDMQAPLLAALRNVVERGLLSELKTFDGCFKIRQVRGISSSLSTHSYALAIDLNSKENPLGGPNKLSKEFVKCFTDTGFIWGGNFRRKDGMHMSFAWE